MKVRTTARGLVDHSVDLTEDDICEAIRFWLHEVKEIDVPESVHIDFDAGCCCLDGATIKWTAEAQND